MALPVIDITNHPVDIQSNTGGLRLIASIQGLNVAGIGDTIVPVLNTKAWSGYYFICCNPSVAITNASVTIFTGANGSGTSIVTQLLNGLALNGLTIKDGSSFDAPSGTDKQNADKLYFRVTAAQGGTATVDCLLFGWDLTFVNS